MTTAKGATWLEIFGERDPLRAVIVPDIMPTSRITTVRLGTGITSIDLSADDARALAYWLLDQLEHSPTR